VPNALTGSQGVALLVSYGIACEILAKVVSSPQTAELNIQSREATLFKWVHLGQLETIVLILIAAKVDSAHRKAILAGGMAAVIVNEAEYQYARISGLKNPGQPTENHGG
jgi:hypothetical protein